MQIRHDERYTEIDVAEMSMEIDDIFHKYITEKTGVTISHEKIYAFVGKFIREHNVEELIKEAEWKKISEGLDELGKEQKDNSSWNKFLRLWK